MNKENTIMFLGDVAAYAPYTFNNKVRAIKKTICEQVLQWIIASGSSCLQVNGSLNYRSPLDGFLKMPCDISDDNYDLMMEKHLKKRRFQRRIAEFLSNPHVPQILKRNHESRAIIEFE